MPVPASSAFSQILGLSGAVFQRWKHRPMAEGDFASSAPPRWNGRAGHGACVAFLRAHPWGMLTRDFHACVALASSAMRLRCVGAVATLFLVRAQLATQFFGLQTMASDKGEIIGGEGEIHGTQNNDAVSAVGYGHTRSAIVGEDKIINAISNTEGEG